MGASAFPEHVLVRGPNEAMADACRAEAGIDSDATEACVTGELLDGTPFEGCDSIIVVGVYCGVGFELALLLPPLMWSRARRRRAID